MASFLLNEEIIPICNSENKHNNKRKTLLEFIRNSKHLSGTKEGCAEGDCGACTVILASLNSKGEVLYMAVNSCLIFLPSLINQAVITLEYLSRKEKGKEMRERQLHPIQEEFVKQHASQCGFCTPGFIMSAAAARFNQKILKDKEDIFEEIAGNLCRCTGYGPILSAISESQKHQEPAWMQERLTSVLENLKKINQTNHSLTSSLTPSSLSITHSVTHPVTHPVTHSDSDGQISYLPSSLNDLLELRKNHPDAKLIAGGTDGGLEYTKKLINQEKVIFLKQVEELNFIREDENSFELGAAVSLDRLLKIMLPQYPNLKPYLKRFAATQIRNQGTVGGNIANASPIGDLSPLLIAMGTSLTLMNLVGSREILLENFFIEYNKQDLQGDEILYKIKIPKISTDCLRAYKISKRLEQDISAVSLGISHQVHQGKISSVVICFGGMAGIPKRAKLAEEFLEGRTPTLENFRSTGKKIGLEFSPLTDQRAGKDYRLSVAENLLERYFHDLNDNFTDLYQSSLDFYPKEDPGIDLSKCNLPDVAFPATQHDSASLHVSGEATYTDDIPEWQDTLHLALVVSPVAHGKLASIETEIDKKFLISSEDITGVNSLSTLHHEPIFSDSMLEYQGQPICGVLADSYREALRLAKKVKINSQALHPIITIDEALDKKFYLTEPVVLEKGSTQETIESSPHRIKGEFYLGGQDHFYLEGQIAYALYRDDMMLVYSSTQHPTEVQHIVAKALSLDYHKVRVVVRRMGGAFGGKESQANLCAAVAALATFKSGKPVKIRLDRDDDMMITGKRHDFKIEYEAGVDSDGTILALQVSHAVRCGHSFDLSEPVANRALAHADNAYYLPNYHITSYRLKTHTVSNTAFRGFGGPQGMIGMEKIIDHIAFQLKIDPFQVRMKNLYDVLGQEKNRCITPYQMKVTDNILDKMMEESLSKADYYQRRKEVMKWNSESKIIKRGIAFNPVKFGISFNVSFLNQAGALVHIYQDGSVKINHGGTEMGQGLMTKCARVAADRFQISLDKVEVSATDTDKVPNTSATAASSGSDINGMAISNACDQIIKRLNQFLINKFQLSKQLTLDEIVWSKGKIYFSDKSLSFNELITMAYFERISLSSTGYYRTPKIHWNGDLFQGRPFYYFAYGVGVSEVAIDTLTGETRQIRCDLLHDVGRSINPALDLGQIEGGYVQGMGWLTSEELVWNQDGKLLTHAPSTYKIPTSLDRPLTMNIKLYNNENSEPTVYRSKAVGEPPLMLAISNFLAINDAVAAVGNYQHYPNLHAPATPQEILKAVNRLQ